MTRPCVRLRDVSPRYKVLDDLRMAACKIMFYPSKGTSQMHCKWLGATDLLRRFPRRLAVLACRLLKLIAAIADAASAERR